MCIIKYLFLSFNAYLEKSDIFTLSLSNSPMHYKPIDTETKRPFKMQSRLQERRILLIKRLLLQISL